MGIPFKAGRKKDEESQKRKLPRRWALVVVGVYKFVECL
jgi:hypothetical protein